MHSKIVIDNIHGEIRLDPSEWKVVDTASFQRLRHLKQLGMGHLTYPNATHTRFAHSLGVFRVMCRIVEAPGLALKSEQKADLRLVALLHDIGHYPYSHLMERIGNVTLTDDALTLPRNQQMPLIQLEATDKPYPDHEELGRFILEKRIDLVEAIGSRERAQWIGNLFSRTEAADQQLSKLIHSSMDMDRIDYLLRDARAAGVPYGEIDLNYLLNSTRISSSGRVGVEQKALAAAEHFLMARMFMYRVVYYHKTTFAFEEACRQLLRRIKDIPAYRMPFSGNDVEKIVDSEKFSDFNDGFVDSRIREAANESDPVIAALAQTILARKAPKMLVEVSGLEDKKEPHNQAAMFKLECKSRLPEVSKKFGIPLGQFLVCGPKPVKFEERSSHFDIHDARKLKEEEREELIMVFWKDEPEPRSIVDVPHGLAAYCSQRVYGISRLYVVDHSKDARVRLLELRKEIAKWESVREIQT